MMISLPIAFLGSQLGAYISFFLSRYCFQDLVIEKLRESEVSNPWLRNFFLIDEIFEEGCEGVKIIAMMRVTLLPYGVTNYVLGVTSARFW